MPLSILNFVQSHADLSFAGSNSLTFGPNGTPASLLVARTPGVAGLEPSAGTYSSLDEDNGRVSSRFGGGLTSSVSVMS